MNDIKIALLKPIGGKLNNQNNYKISVFAEIFYFPLLHRVLIFEKF